jgi:hypothetical protein
MASRRPPPGLGPTRLGQGGRARRSRQRAGQIAARPVARASPTARWRVLDAADRPMSWSGEPPTTAPSSRPAGGGTENGRPCGRHPPMMERQGPAPASFGSAAPAAVYARLRDWLDVCRRFEALGEERLELVERDQVGAVVEVDVACARYDDELLGAGGLLVDGVGDVPRVRVLARDDEQGARRPATQMRRSGRRAAPGVTRLVDVRCACSGCRLPAPWGRCAMSIRAVR